MSLIKLFSSLEYVSLMKPVVFPDIPFSSPEFSQNPFESFGVHVRRQEQYELLSRAQTIRIKLEEKARKGNTIWINWWVSGFFTYSLCTCVKMDIFHL